MIEIKTSATPSVAQWKAVIAGCRNPYASWDKSDSTMHFDGNTGEIYHMVGNADLDLMKRLSRAGDDHGKFLRMLPVIADIRAPLYWWKQLDTYKVGTVANSDSTMHCIHKQEFSLDDFSYDEVDDETMSVLCDVIKELNRCRSMYNVTKERSYWNSMITLLPESYMQHRTWSTNYQTLKHIYNARKDHKLGEWHDFCQEIYALQKAALVMDAYEQGYLVERKKGKWEKVYYGNRPNRCSECRQKNNYRTNFCPNCGADMRGKT